MLGRGSGLITFKCSYETLTYTRPRNKLNYKNINISLDIVEMYKKYGEQLMNNVKEILF